MIDDHVRSKNIGQIIHLNKRQTMTPIHTVEYGSEGKKPNLIIMSQKNFLTVRNPEQNKNDDDDDEK